MTYKKNSESMEGKKKDNNNKVTKMTKKGLTSPCWLTFKLLWNYSKDKITE